MAVLSFPVHHALAHRIIRYAMGLAMASILGCGTGPDAAKQRLLLKANRMTDQGNYDLAISSLKEALRIDSCFSDAWNNLGTVAYRRKQWTEAVDYYSHALACDPKFFKSILNRAMTYYETGNDGLALADARRMQKLKPDTAVAYFMSGLIQVQRSNFDRAEGDFAKAAELDSGNAEIKVNMATVLYYKRKYARSRALIQNVLMNDSVNADAANLMALLETAAGDNHSALGYANQALAMEPTNAFYLNNRGYVYLQLGRLESGMDDINESLSLDPTNAWAHRNKGIFYLKSGDPVQALKSFERAAKPGGYVEDVYLFMGDTYRALGEKAEACRAWSLELMNPLARERLKECR